MAERPAGREEPSESRFSNMRFAVSGASGFIGSRLCAALLKKEKNVVALSRREPSWLAGSKALWKKYDLTDELDAGALLGGVDVVIHCAHSQAPDESARYLAQNVEGARRIKVAAEKAGVKQFVYISSISSHPAAESLYGRSKLSAERLMDPARDLIVRPGLVVGDGGIFARMSGSLAKTRIVPLFFGGAQVIQPVWIEDLCSGIMIAVEKKMTGTLNIADPDGMSYRDFFRAIGRRMGVEPVFVPLPGAVALMCLKLTETLGIKLPVTSENLLGLKAMIKFESAPDLARLGILLKRF